MNDSVVIVSHAKYGSVVWHVVKRDPSSITLIADPLPEPVAFYNPKLHTLAHYIRTDFSSARTSDESGTLFEIQNPPSPRDKENAQRYKDIMEYGSNQWAVSDIRQILNTEFLHGLSDDFKRRILPQSHDLVLGKTSCSKDFSGKTPSQRTSHGDEVYDEYCGSVRFTRNIVIDSIFIPSDSDSSIVAGFIASSSVFNHPMNFWLINAATTSSAPYLVKAASVAMDSQGNKKIYFTENNARHPLRICPMCVISAE